EFIRLQIELACFGQWDESPRKAELEKREKSLWRKHAKAWRAGLPSPLKVGQFRRGFPHPPEQSVTGKQFLAFPEVKLDAAPLWTFNLTDTTGPILSRIASSRVLSRTEKWMIWEEMDELAPENIEEFVGALNARNLTTLGLTSQPLRDAGMLVFVRSANLPHLTALHVGECDITDEGVRTLSGWSGAEGLQELMLEVNALTDESLDVIATGPLGRGLRSLVIHDNPRFTTAGWLRLLKSPAADSLAFLNANGRAITPAFAEALSASPRSRAMRELILCDTKLGDRGVSAILDSPHLENLKFLYVRDCGIRIGGKVAKRLDAEFSEGGLGNGAGGFRASRTS
ncbi:MAG: hypothetical protein L0241_06450, partial [Planctomycetia bacterium]|nr:hypothetical protein [Planctomycetia bacterium]